MLVFGDTIDSSFSTFFTDKRLILQKSDHRELFVNVTRNCSAGWCCSAYLVSHDVEPVPVLTQRPELFVFVTSGSLSLLICKCETLADIVSPINTSFKAKYGKIVLTFESYLCVSSSDSARDWSAAVVGVVIPNSCKSVAAGTSPFCPNNVILMRDLWIHLKSP